MVTHTDFTCPRAVRVRVRVRFRCRVRVTRVTRVRVNVERGWKRQLIGHTHRLDLPKG